jgi:hypothetical protein
MAAFERDLHAGMPIYFLLGRYDKLIGSERNQLVDAQRSGFGSFGSLQGDPEFRELPLPVEPIAVHDIAWQDGVVGPDGSDPHLIFELPEPQFVAGLQLKYAHESEDRGGPEPFRISCKQGASDYFSEARTRISRFHCLGPGTELATVWIGAKVKQFRIRPFAEKGTYNMRIFRITLLLPVHADRFTAQDEDADVPPQVGVRRLESPQELIAFDQFATTWPVDLLQSLQVFLHDIWFGVRP